jgi:molybdate transport system substrate-binding protein
MLYIGFATPSYILRRIAMVKRWRILLFLFLMIIPAACSNKDQAITQLSANQQNASHPSPTEKVELMVSAAASLKDVMNDIKTSFESKHPTIMLTFNFGSSGKLAQQIEQGAPSDIFLSASKKDMDTVQGKDLVLNDTRTDFAKNELVLIANTDSTLNVSSFDNIPVNKIGHFAIGEPESVPAGRYTKETFQKLKLWEPLQSKLVMGSDVRQVLTYVESGNVELGVVYSSDALVSKKVRVLATAKQEWHKPIVYPGAVIANTTHADDAKVFITFLLSEKGQEILRKNGFK